ncbi:BZ3500_MvSof-1268-A1-R1_Chr4-2g07085 [Microbotryum saponariae]|uniref:BZ3500_MvSof-1268-A1-R1_Chr4-2g07085 protein n=1 Tax=Microbotryum saponariae TaxID=289078 RepID=A0A2X0KZ51_9BASI|nr:BZ3500_MvSof-1268-A1-R1_Chr4-2g07085 [Microbotryum saponariae]SDA06750.1 BZ3501_MvSof-1269-A2-R1_Chr4-2g06796 [Microbotryum saponariae]
MKYGKKYQETLQAPGIPEEWRQQAIEYRQLKKVINRVATELKDLGLTSDVLKDLLSQQSTASTSTSSATSTHSSPLSKGKDRPRRRSSTVRASTSGHLSTSPIFAPSEDDKLEAAVRIESVADEEAVTWDSSEDSSHDAPMSNGQLRKDKRRRQSKLRRARASYELAGDSSNPEPRIHIVFSSASSASISESSSGESSSSAHVRGQIGSHSSNRFTELHDSSEDDSSPARSADGDDLLPHQHHEHHHHRSKHHQHHVKAPTEGGDESANEEGTTTSSSSAHRAKIQFEGAGPQANALLKKMYGLEESDTEINEPDPEGQGEDEDEDHAKAMQELAEVELDLEPKRRRSDETLRSTVPVDQEHVEAMKKLSMDTEKSARRTSLVEQANERQASDADDEGPERPRRRHIHHQPRKEVFIPLNKDNEFLGLLAKALASLAALQLAQKQNFTTAVELLAREVSAVSSPNRPKSDLYIWREIFSLWVEAQIFESARERDRGERSVEAVQEKLSWFVDQVAKRKLAKRMKHKESRHALERFIQLNVELLDMKKFQLANEEAARKILKKHDKRTALTASLGFPKFIAAASSLSASSSPDNPNSRVLTLPGFPSLPHVLLSTFTATLLPVIPQLEDYECAICGEVAFKPIRLECGHKFCVRCLVKMQKRGQDACPQCRSPVVLRANATNLDTAMQSYLQLWFPKEVKAKAKSNAKEAAKEELAEMGMDDHRCAVM